jgi:hypothetical protein
MDIRGATFPRRERHVMINPALTATLMVACCMMETAHAGLNDRTKKLIQAQALNRPPAASAARKNVPSNGGTARTSQGTTSRGPSGGRAGDRGAATSIAPATKR